MQPEPSELQDLVRDLHREAEPWLPAGSASRLHWGPAVRQPCQVLSCSRLNRILEHNPGDFTITVEAGVPLQEVQAALALQRQWLPIDPAWGTPPQWGGGELNPTGGSIGGLVARGLAGGYRQRYLGIRDQLIGIRLLRADGIAAHAGGKVVKNVAGYDLMRLFCGSWGSLGLITELTLRTMPLPPQRRGLLVQGPLTQLSSLSRWLLAAATLSPERIDWWSAPLAAAAGLEHQPLLLIALASVSSTSLDEQIAAIRCHTNLPARCVESDQLEVLLARTRSGAAAAPCPTAACPTGAGVLAGPSAEHRSELRPSWLLRLGVNPDRVDTLLAVSQLEGLAVELAAGSGLGLAWSQVAAAGGPSGDPLAAQRATLTSQGVLELRQICGQLGGYLTVLVQPPGGNLPAWGDAPARPLIETIKRRFDPKLQLAPGRLPGVATPEPAAGPDGPAS